MAFEKPKKNPALALLSWRCRDIKIAMSWVSSSVTTLACCDGILMSY